jgi:DNA invertase Pin-like site-specific DNA recombinase
MQLQTLQSAGCETIYKEKASGTSSHRQALEACLSFLRTGDTLVVYKLDRLARSLKSIISILDELRGKNIAFISLQDNISTEGPYGELMTNIIGAFAQFERDIIIERCQEGRKVAKEKGIKFGRPTGGVNTKNKDKVAACAQLYAAGGSIESIMAALQIGSKQTVYRYLGKCGITPNRL